MNNDINIDFFSNLSGYSEYAIKCSLAGMRPNDQKLLNSNMFHEVEGHYWMIFNGHIVFIDLKTSFEEKNVVIKGDFDCSYCKNLTSLKGAPKKVGGRFDCSWCENLISLKGATKKVGGDFKCIGCHSLTSLEGAPKKVAGRFDCSWCNNLTSLNGAPEKVGGDFKCSWCNNLTSLNGVPEKVGGRIDSVIQQ